jgi:hypothetical protein
MTSMLSSVSSLWGYVPSASQIGAGAKYLLSNTSGKTVGEIVVTSVSNAAAQVHKYVDSLQIQQTASNVLEMMSKKPGAMTNGFVSGGVILGTLYCGTRLITSGCRNVACLELASGLGKVTLGLGCMMIAANEVIRLGRQGNAYVQCLDAQSGWFGNQSVCSAI